MSNLALLPKEERVAIVDPRSTPSQRVDGLTSPRLATLGMSLKVTLTA